VRVLKQLQRGVVVELQAPQRDLPPKVAVRPVGSDLGEVQRVERVGDGI
jgi:hypothetical protein